MKLIKQSFALMLSMMTVVMLTGCAVETHRNVKVQHVDTFQKSYNGPRATLAIGKFDNRSSYMNGLFASGTDQISNQAKSVLISHLQQTNRFNVMDRGNMDELQAEAELQGTMQQLKGADYIVTGSVAEFGRKQLSDGQLFGVSRGKQQVAYAKINLNVVNIRTSEVVYSTQGSGEYKLSTREIVGFNRSAGYDSTLNGKVLDLAMRDAINTLVKDLDQKSWSLS